MFKPVSMLTALCLAGCAAPEGRMKSGEALGAGAAVSGPNLIGHHALLAVDGKPLPVDAGMLPDEDGTMTHPGVIAAGFLRLDPTGRYEFYHEYRSARSGRVLARDRVGGSYNVAGDRLTLVGDPHPSGKPINWAGKVGRTSFTVHYDGLNLTFQR